MATNKKSKRSNKAFPEKLHCEAGLELLSAFLALVNFHLMHALVRIVKACKYSFLILAEISIGCAIDDQMPLPGARINCMVDGFEYPTIPRRRADAATLKSFGFIPIILETFSSDSILYGCEAHFS